MNITGIARENFEEAGLPLKNTIELTTKNEYTIPDIWGLKVGRKFLDTGEIESHFEEQQFFEIRKRATLLEYPHTVILMEQDFAERKVIDYYVIYDIKESSKYKPTIVNEYVDNIILGTGEYKCEYEILLSCGDATRRLVIQNIRKYEERSYEDKNDIKKGNGLSVCSSNGSNRSVFLGRNGSLRVGRCIY